jgi:hypothetical protein
MSRTLPRLGLILTGVAVLGLAPSATIRASSSIRR